jgi:hypothetical protein
MIVGLAAGDAARHALYPQLDSVLGDEHAGTLMSYLPRDESEEVATKAISPDWIVASRGAFDG